MSIEGTRRLVYVDVSSAVHQKAGLRRYTENLVLALQPLMGDQLALFQNGLDSGNRLNGFANHLLAGVPETYRTWRTKVLLGQLLGIGCDRLLPDAALFHATEHLLLPLKRVPSVITVHDLVFQRYPQYHKRLNYLYLRAAMPLFCRRASHIIAVSQSTKRDLMHYYDLPDEKITVIPEAAAPHFAPATPEQVERTRAKFSLPPRYLLTVGTIEPRKNLPRLLQACEPLLNEGVVDALVIVGHEGWLTESFHTFLAAYPQRERVIRPGFVSEEELIALYGGALLSVQPSLYEGFGLPVLEAMACGSPVCCSNVSSLPEVGGSAARYFDPDSVEDMRSMLREVASDGMLLRQMRQASLARAAEFSWESTARQTLALYNQLIAK